MEDRQITLNIDSDVETRKGVYSDIALVSRHSDMARVDFISGDRPGAGSIGAVLSCRVYMPLSSLVALRDSINDQLAATPEGGEGIEHV